MTKDMKLAVEASAAYVRDLRSLGKQVLHIAAEIEKDGEQIETILPRSPEVEISKSQLLANAKLAYVERRRRDEIFGLNIFGEAAWDILLDLYINHLKGSMITVTSACVAACVPQTTALRWISVLEEEKLIVHFRSKRDNRMRLLELSRRGIELMENWVAGRLGVSAADNVSKRTISGDYLIK